VRMSHDEAYAYHARALYNIAKTYSGEQGQSFLLADSTSQRIIE